MIPRSKPPVSRRVLDAMTGDRYLEIRSHGRRPGGVTVDCVVVVGYVIKVRVWGPWSPRASAPIDNSGAAVSTPITSHDLAMWCSPFGKIRGNAAVNRRSGIDIAGQCVCAVALKICSMMLPNGHDLTAVWCWGGMWSNGPGGVTRAVGHSAV